ncbi:MAG: cytochrome C [Desulfuromonadales bacterium GWD2_61_12]|nr:MAG: cytochrome C [Desulfuromonadales bacterium GWC2_61_20]OGR36826.1 MAG: cytochrome C [Desulfuromonadales bacterium GWD2_61_12]HAD03560.1 cytochrome C [Desulfuromonas sp.]HBT82825.1 cytochrome C [Desulfuromonas sp.]
MKYIIAPIAMLLLTTAAVGAEEITWRNSIKPIVQERCLGCHGPDSAPEYPAFKEQKEQWLAKGQAMRMDSYSHLIAFVVWPNTGATMRRLDDGQNSKDGKPGNMYRHLGASEEERQENLAAFKGWIGHWSLKRWADTSKDELNGIKAKY